MKIRNEFVKIKTKEREFTFKNLILDNYLSVLMRCEFDELTCQYYGNGNRSMSRCYLKLDTPLEKEIAKDMYVFEQDFDIYLNYPTINQSGTPNAVSILYSFDDQFGYYDIENGSWQIDFHQLGNRKITAIAFGNDTEVFAILDTSNYNLFVPADSYLSVSRRDNISTDALFNTKDNLDYPLHLAPIGIRDKGLFGDQALYYYEYGILYSVGLSGTAGILQEEYVLGEDAYVIQIDDFSFKFALEKSTERTKYPEVTIHPSSTRFPVRFNAFDEKHPSTIIFPGNNKYPMQSDYKYVVMKFRTYYIHPTLGTFVWTGKEYTMSIYTETKGLFEVITKLERGD